MLMLASRRCGASLIALYKDLRKILGSADDIIGRGLSFTCMTRGRPTDCDETSSATAAAATAATAAATANEVGLLEEFLLSNSKDSECC
jgi:negative regulator of replication initiation